jgi:Uma2 family endonuclease
MATATLIAVEEYLATSYEPDREYVEGRLVERNVGEHDHSRLQALLAAQFCSLEKRYPIRVFTEQRVRVATGERRHRYRIPDICVMLRPYHRERVLTEPPLIAIEILSPDDTMTSIMERIEDFRLFGIVHIWVVDPRSRRTYTFERRESDTALREVPGKKMPIAELGIEIDFNTLFVELEAE